MNDSHSAAPICGLIEISEKGRVMFQSAAEKSRDGLRFLFTALSQQHQQFVDDLAALVPEAAVTRQMKSRSDAGLDFGRGPDANDEAGIVSQCAQTENEVVLSYEDTLVREDFPATAKNVVQRQLTSLRTARNYLRSLCACP